MSDFLVKYEDRHLKTHCRPNTRDTWRSVLERYIIPFFGNMLLAEVRPEAISKFIKHQQEAKMPNGERRLSNATINKHLELLSSVLTKAVRWEYLPKAPYIDYLPVVQSGDANKDHLYLNFERAQAFMEAAGSDAAILSFGLNTGLRPGELLGLKWDDINLDKNCVHVRRTRTKGVDGPTKGGYYRDVPLNANAIRALETLKRSKLMGSYVFCNPSTGEPYTLKQLSTMMKRTCKNAGVKAVTPKALRHSFASHLVMQGNSLEVVSMIMGHSSVRVTKTYVHLCPTWASGVLDGLCDGWPATGVVARREDT